MTVLVVVWVLLMLIALPAECVDRRRSTKQTPNRDEACDMHKVRSFVKYRPCTMTHLHRHSILRFLRPNRLPTVHPSASPMREPFVCAYVLSDQGRGDLLAYAAEQGIPVSSTPKVC